MCAAFQDLQHPVWLLGSVHCICTLQAAALCRRREKLRATACYGCGMLHSHNCNEAGRRPAAQACVAAHAEMHASLVVSTGHSLKYCWMLCIRVFQTFFGQHCRGDGGQHCRGVEGVESMPCPCRYSRHSMCFLHVHGCICSRHVRGIVGCSSAVVIVPRSL